jgi:hypothetical protein
MRLFGILVLIILGVNSQAQEDLEAKSIEKIRTNKGRIYGYWGWNRSWYTNSDIYFNGENYAFELKNVKATDKQTAFDLGTYFGLSTITIPQTNLRIGYFISHNWDISFGVDHMKYVMVSEQESEISGRINNGSDFDGVYGNNTFNINKPFLEFEHTDGLNYLNLELTYNKNILHLLNVKNNPDKMEINGIVGAGIGAMMPKSNVTLMGGARNDDFHLAGYGFGAKFGLNVTFYNYFFVRTEYKAGFTHLPDVRTTPNLIDKASQHFWYTQLNINFGFSFNPFT